MRKTCIKKIAPLTALGFLSIFQGCRQEPAIYPAAELTSKTALSVNDVSSAAGKPLVVTTILSGADKIPQPSRLCVAGDGSVYITSQNQGKVFKVANDKLVTTIIDHCYSPVGIKAAKNGDIYVAVAKEDKILKINSDGTLSKVASAFALDNPTDIAIAADGTLYIADAGNRRILKVLPGGQTSILAGQTGVFGFKNGQGTNANFSYLSSIRIADNGNLYVVDGDGTSRNGQTIRMITPTGMVSTYFSQKNHDEVILDLELKSLDSSLNPSKANNVFLVYQSNKITTLDAYGNEIPLSAITQSGNSDGILSTQGRFSIPSGISFNGNDLYIIDSDNYALRKISKS